MPDPIRRRPRPSADTDVFVGPLPEDDAPAPADADVLERMESIRRTLAPTNEALSVPTDPVRDDATLSSIRRGMVDYAREQTSPAAERQRAAAALVRATEDARTFRERQRQAAVAEVNARAPVGVDTTETPSAITSAVRGAARTIPLAGSWMDEALGAAQTAKHVITGDTPIERIPEDYRRNQQAWDYWYDRAAAENPLAHSLGSGSGLAAGTLAMGLSPFGTRMNNAITAAETSLPAAFSGANALGRLARGTEAAALMGAIDQAGASDAPLLSGETGRRAAGGAMLGAALNLPIQGGLEGVSWLANRLSPASVRELAESGAEALANTQVGGETGDVARRMLAGTPEARQLRAAAVAGERGMDDVAQRGAAEFGRFLDASEEAMGAVTHDTDKVRRLAERFAQEPPNPQAVDDALSTLESVAGDLDWMSGQSMTGPLRSRSREALRQIQSLRQAVDEIGVDFATPEGQAQVYALLDSAKKSVGRAYSSYLRSTGQNRPGVTTPSHSPNRAFERAYDRLRQNLENPDMWGEAATSLQRPLNAAYTEYIPYADELASLAEEGAERSANSGFTQRSAANARAWSDLANNASRWEDQARRDSIRQGVRAAGRLAETVDQQLAGGRAAEAAQRMRQSGSAIEDIINQMEIQGRARDELRQLAGVKVRGVSLDQVVRYLAQAEAAAQSGNAAVRGGAAAGAEALSRMQRAANAMQTIRRYMAAPTANVAEVARVIAGFAAEDPTILEGAAQMPDANAASPASVATDEQFDPDYLPGELGASPEIAPTPTLRNEPRRQQDADEFDPDYLP